MDDQPGLSVVVPVYKSEAMLRLLVDRLRAVCVQLAQPFEIILVNDGSPDGSWGQITALAQEDSNVRGIDLMRNYGQHNALLCGVRAAQFGVIVTLDDDLQNPPEEIPLLLAKLDEGYEVVYGAPRQGAHGRYRRVASWLTKVVLQHGMGAATATSVSSFRAFRTPVREAFSSYNSPDVSLDVLLTWGTSRFSSVSVHHAARVSGASNYTFTKLVTHAFSLVTGFSLLPLQLATLLGFLFTLIGLAIAAYVLLNFLVRGGTVPGFTFLACLIAIFSGVQLFALGMIGEYLARVHFRTMGRQSYIIRAHNDLDARSLDG
ncbi:MAG: glycosyltransferase family 2 protein [Chloroflexota bacterium]|nr:glycosyltransferase family 2 protein [Chloroflexota bacterium]